MRAAARLAVVLTLVVGAALTSGARATGDPSADPSASPTESPSPTETPPPTRPNVVLIVTDDQRWDQVDLMPTLQEQLVAQGTTFSNAFVVNPLCCPSRTSTFTGRYSHSTGVYDNGGTYGGFASFADSSTIATWLQDAGYRTGLVGKYLNGYEDAGYTPPGWDVWNAFVGGVNYYDYTLNIDGTTVPYGSEDADYSTDVLAEDAARFIDETPADQPLFLAFTPFAPHAGWIAPPRYQDAFPDFQGIPTAEPERGGRVGQAGVGAEPPVQAGVDVRHAAAAPGADAPGGRRRDREHHRCARSDGQDRADAVRLHIGQRSLRGLAPVGRQDHAVGRGDPGAAHRPLRPARAGGHVRSVRPQRRPGAHDRGDRRGVGTRSRRCVAAAAAGGTDRRLAHAVPDRELRGGIPTDAPPSYCAVRSDAYLYVRYTTGEEELYDLAADPFQLNSVHADVAYADIREALYDELVTMCSPPPPGYSFGEAPPGTLTTPEDVAVASGLWDGVPIRTYGSYPMDVDVDELPDVLLVPHVAKPARLLHNDGGSFSLMATFPKRDRHGCAAADVDLDGLPDIYCSIGADSGTAVKSNELWMQTEPGTFVDQAAAMGVADPYGRGREVLFVDANHDPYPDLYVTNEYPRADSVPSPNRLFINEGGTGFRDAPEYGLDVEVGGVLGTQTCVQSEEISGDGWQDLLVCGKGGLRMYVRTGSTYTDQRAALKMPKGVFFDARLADMNGDGVLDLVGLGKTKLSVYLRTGGLFRAAAYSRSIGTPRQLEVADLDQDGDPDIYVVTGASSGTNLPDVLLENDGTGRAFRSVDTVPASGDGLSVISVDHDDNGTLDLIVMNGFKTVAGPVQLLSFPPQS